MKIRTHRVVLGVFLSMCFLLSFNSRSFAHSRRADVSNHTMSISFGSVSGLVPDMGGRYVVQLVVYEPMAASAMTEMTIGASTPEAAVGSELVHESVTASEVRLNGASNSDLEGQPLTRKWQLLTSPVDTKVACSSNTATSASLFTDFVIDNRSGREYYSATIEGRCPPQRKQVVLASKLTFHTF